MTQLMTLIEKQCGHVGFVQHEYPHDSVSCTQCAVLEKTTQEIVVPIIRKKVIKASIPSNDPKQVSKWIQEQLLEASNGN